MAHDTYYKQYVGYVSSPTDTLFFAPVASAKGPRINARGRGGSWIPLPGRRAAGGGVYTGHAEGASRPAPRESVRACDRFSGYLRRARHRPRAADGQDAGEMLLNIEARIGELLPSAEEALRLGGQKPGTPKGGGGSKVLSPDMKSKQAQAARAIHRNPAAVKAGTSSWTGASCWGKGNGVAIRT